MSEKLQKGVLSVDGNNLHMAMPFNKVNKSKRTVSGFATLDNVDSQGDIVLAEASAGAFARARGNLREMHKKDSAVGRVVKWREETVFDEEEGELRGIFVTARVSEGAPDTWLKVLDGTLSGFSIGGEINKASNKFSKDAGKEVRVIEDYDLVELSLVDNPANQKANVTGFEKNIFSMEKAADGSVKSITGMVAETVIENVFICTNDETIIIKDSDALECPTCSTDMENAGWFENGPQRTEKVREIISKFLTPTETEAAPENANSEGGVEKMGTEKDNTRPAPEGSAETPAPEGSEDQVHTADVAETVDETEGTEKSAVAETVEEVQDDESEISKKIEELHVAVKDSLEKSREDTNTRVESLESKIDEINDAFSKKASELEERFNEFGEKLEAAKSRLAGFEKSLESINSSEAIRKSADLDEPAEPVQKSKTELWGRGTFSTDQLFR